MTVYFVCWELEANSSILFAERNGAGWKLLRQDSPSLLACAACLTLLVVLLAATAVRGNNYSLVYFTSQRLPLQQQLSRILPPAVMLLGWKQWICSVTYSILSILSELCKWSYQMEAPQATPEATLLDGAGKYRNRPLILSGKLHLWKLWWTLERKERGHRPWRISSDKTHSAWGKSSSEEFCVSMIPISQISENEAGSKDEVAEAAEGTPKSGSAFKSHQLNYNFVNHSSGKYTPRTRMILLLSSLIDLCW